MSEFIKGAYNINEHDHIRQSTEHMNRRLEQLAEINQPWQHSQERRTQIRHEMALISFEMSERLREHYGMEIEEAWGEHERV